EEVNERCEREAGDDDDPRDGVDVERALEAAPPGEMPQKLVEIARVRREEERPPEDARERRQDDRQDRDDAQHAQPPRQRGGGPRESGPEDECDRERADAEEERVADRLP